MFTGFTCNKSRSRDYANQSLITVSLTLSLAKTQRSQSLAKIQGSAVGCIDLMSYFAPILKTLCSCDQEEH